VTDLEDSHSDRARPHKGDRVPVIIGIGESIHRDDDDWAGAEPLELMETAARRAFDDARMGHDAKVDSVDVLHVQAWRYDDLPALVAQRLGIDVPRGTLYPVGGETPLRVLDDVARRIQRGETDVALIVGAESTRAADRCAKAGGTLGWTPMHKPRTRWQVPDTWRRIVDIGVQRAMHIFSLYENALRAHEGVSLADAQDESATLWAALSRVAAENPYAWSTEPVDAATVRTVTAANRLVAFPFTKRMTANPFVNQGAALVVTDTTTARRWRVPEDRWIYPWGSAGADEPAEVLSRAGFHRSAAVEHAIVNAQRLTDTTADDYSFVELYSCFPTMPKLSGRVLGPIKPDAPSVTGGLSFFGGPGSNYLTHSIAAMVQRLRESGGLGFIHGVGEMMTKHHALVLGASPRDGGYAADPQGIMAVTPSDVAIDDGYEGEGVVETCSISYRRDGTPDYGIVIGRGRAGQRFGARVEAGDAATLAAFESPTTEAIGQRGRVFSTAAGHRFTIG
jgi:acetyl-CoA C-acetyltransferase